MKVLIIGGAGYIGSHVRLAMTEAGHQVHIFDNLSSGLRENLTPDIGFTHGDILHYQNLVQTMREQGPFDAVIHLAALKAAGESMIKPEKYSVANITGTLNILNAMCETGISRIVFSSSAATFGEPQYLPLDEDHPANPENYYGFTKLEIERFLAWYDTLKGIKFAALRYFNAAGYDSQGRISGLERNPANLLPVIMEVAAGLRKELQIFGNDYDTPDGTGVRDYVHVTDLASGHVKALEYITNQKESLLVNLGSETGISVTEMLETARRITQRQIPAKTVPRRPGDPAKLYATSARAKSLLGWEAKHSSVEELVATTWQAYTRALSLD